MTNFRNSASIEDIKLPPTSHFKAKRYDPTGNYAPLDENDLELFLQYLSQTGVPSDAAHRLGRTEIPFQMKREECVHFAAAYDWAMRRAADLLLIEARERAVKGKEKTIWYKGEDVGSVTEYSDTLMVLLLKNLHPQFKNDEDDGVAAGQIGTVIIKSVPKGQKIDVSATVKETSDE